MKPPRSAPRRQSRAKTPVRRVTSPAPRKEATPLADRRTALPKVAIALVTTGFAVGTLGVRRSDDHDGGQVIPVMPVTATRERGPSELCGPLRRTRSSEDSSIIPAKCKNTKPASSIANAPMRLFHWLSSAQFVHASSDAP